MGITESTEVSQNLVTGVLKYEEETEFGFGDLSK
jgi:hypothetical protein